MKKVVLVSLALLLMGASCQKTTREFHTSDIEVDFSDEELLELAFGKKEYYKEHCSAKNDKGNSYYLSSTNIDTRGYTVVGEEKKYYEVCTDDPGQALEWSNIFAKGDYIGDVIEASETEKYFEYVWEYIPKSEKAIKSTISRRIHKCSYYDNENAGSYILGTFNKRPVNEENVKELIEHLWEPYICDLGRDELKPVIVDEGDNIRYALYSVELSGASDWGFCNYAILKKQEFKVNKSTGIVTTENLEGDTIKSIKTDDCMQMN